MKGDQSAKLSAGIDEVGRGPIAGPVVAATVILNPEDPISGLTDSKQLTARAREQLAKEIMGRALYWAVGQASVEEIDSLNILQATLLAMKRSFTIASMYCNRTITKAMVDGNHAPEFPIQVECVVRGDLHVKEISAASIVAKVARDSLMREAARLYPEYGFEQHKGYPTAGHITTLNKFGPCKLHRTSFSPIRNFIEIRNS